MRLLSTLLFGVFSFVTSVQGQCDSTSFFDIDADAVWQNTFAGETICISLFADDYISFDDPSSFNDCWGLEFGYGLEVEWTLSPDGSDFEWLYAYGELCYGSGLVQAYYSASTTGSYEGRFLLQPDESCDVVAVPFSFTITEEEIPNAVVDDAGWTGAFDGDTTCASYYSYQTANFLDPSGYDDCSGVNLDYGVEVELLQAPDGNDFFVDYAYGELCYGSGYMEVQHYASVPGNYQGNFLIQASGACQVVEVPFSFTISDEDSPNAVVDDAGWTGAFDGDTTCASYYSYQTANFLDPSGYDDCSGVNLDYGVEVELLLAPDGSDFFIDYAYGQLCYGSGYMEVQHYASVPGNYQGNFLIQASGACQVVEVPFSFTITEEEIPNAVVDNADWTGSFDGDTTCASIYAYQWIEFNDPSGYGDCDGVGLGNGVEVELLQAPDGNDFFVDYAYGELCYGSGYMEVQHYASVPGNYQGNFLIQASGACQVVEVPFSFTIVDEDIPAIVAEDANWSGTFKGDTTCAIASANSYTSFNHPSGYSGYWSGNLGYGIDFEMIAAPDSNDFDVIYVYGELWYGSVYLEVQHSVSTPGDYEGSFFIQAQGECQAVEVPFSFTISEEDLEPSLAENISGFGSLNGGTICGSSGSANISFNYQGTSPYCWWDFWGSGVDVAVDISPELNDLVISPSYAEMCYLSGGISFDYSVSTPGLYAGSFFLYPSTECRGVEVPFEFTVSGDDVPNVVAESVSWNGVFDGQTTCPTGYASDYVYFDDPTGTGDCVGVDFGSGLDFALTSAPDSNDFSVTYGYGSLCYGGYLDIQYSVSTPGFYEGNFFIQTNGACQIIQVPFSFTVTDDPLPTFLATDVDWSGSFGGGSSCPTSFENGQYAYFNDPSGAYNCSEGMALYSGMDVELTLAPDSSDFEVTYGYGELCYGGYVDLQYNVSTPGNYQGQVLLQAPGSCNIVAVAFAFAINEPEDSLVQAQSVEWSGYFDGDTLCSNLFGNQYAQFVIPTDYDNCSDVNLGTGLSVAITMAPDSGDFEVSSGYGQLCYNDGYLSVDYSVSTPGEYAGSFIIEASGACELVEVPFSFTLSSEEFPPALVDPVEWSGVLNGDTTCASLYSNESAYFEDPTDFFEGQGYYDYWWYYDCWWGGLGTGVEIQLDEAPSDHDLDILNADVNLCPDGYVNLEYAVSTPGFYAGSILIQPNGACQRIQIPFSMIVASESVPVDSLDFLAWTTPFEGDTMCATLGSYAQAYFNYAATLDDWWNINLGYGLEFELVSAPDSSDFEIFYAYGSGYGGEGNLDVEYAVSIPGQYEGRFVMQPNGECELVEIPFHFTVGGDVFINEVDDHAWDGLPSGADCGTDQEYWEAYTNLYELSMGNEYLEWSMGYGLEMDILEAPDSNDFVVEWGYVYMEGEWGDLSFGYSVSTPGEYEGRFLFSGPNSCELMSVPFAFEIMEMDALGNCDGDCEADLNADGICDSEQVLGCTDEEACNFDADANDDDGTCEFPDDPCDDLDEFTFNDSINDLCLCVGDSAIFGCTDSLSCSYDMDATVDDGSCLYLDALDECGGNCFEADSLGNCIQDIILGCVDTLACNYEIDANTDDNSCVIPGDACDDGDSLTTNDVIDESCMCGGEEIALGCLDTLACNYDMTANVENGSCLYPGDSCNDADEDTVEDVLDENCDCTGTSKVATPQFDFGMFPNPTSGELTLQIEGIVMNASIRILDAAGRISWSAPSMEIHENQVLNLSSLSDGLYTVVIQSDGLTAIRRLAIQR